MNKEELEKLFEELLEGGTETQRIEFKSSCPWKDTMFAKDLLALSNVRGAGYIIIGIKQVDEKFEREGISKEDLETYNLETMQDQIGGFADPGVDFELYNIDKDEKKYLMIIVKEFQDIPIICKKDSSDTNKAVIYYRNTDRRPESAPVSNSYDMRDIIELAVVKMMKKKRELGFVVESADEAKFDEELGEK